MKGRKEREKERNEGKYVNRKKRKRGTKSKHGNG